MRGHARIQAPLRILLETIAHGILIRPSLAGLYYAVRRRTQVWLITGRDLEIMMTKITRRTLGLGLLSLPICVLASAALADETDSGDWPKEEPRDPEDVEQRDEEKGKRRRGKKSGRGRNRRERDEVNEREIDRELH